MICLYMLALIVLKTWGNSNVFKDVNSNNEIRSSSSDLIKHFKVMSECIWPAGCIIVQLPKRKVEEEK